LVTIYLRKPIKVEPGQYINLWILCSPLSVFQRHPFTIVSCPTRPQSELTLFIKPRRGLTKSFLNLVKYGSTTTIAAFTGPHGRKLPTQEVYHVLLFATDFRIAAVIPYLRVLIDSHHAHELCIKRVHLVWQLSNPGMCYVPLDLF
jgi:NAD(P)H-flavin reductase